MLLQPKFYAALTTATIAAVVASQPQAYAASSWVGTAHYDAYRKAVIVPYSGAFPTFLTDSLGGPPRVYFDFDASTSLRGLRESSVIGHPSLVRWAMAKKGAGKVRLVLTFNHGTKVLVLNDASHRQIILIPQGVGVAWAPTPTATMMPAPVTVPWHVGQSHTFKQTFGTTDFAYTVGPRAKNARRDSVDVNVKSSGVTDFHVTSDPVKDYVSFSISIKGRPTMSQIMRPMPRPTPRASVVRPTPRPNPILMPIETPTPEPSALPTPEPLPTPTPEPVATPTPAPSPSPSPTAAPVSSGPGVILSLKGGYLLNSEETFTGVAPAGGSAPASSFTASGASEEGADFEARFLESWAFLLGADYDHLQITDQQTNNQTGHNRDEIEGNLGVGYRFTPGGTEEMFGLGVIGRYISSDTVQLSDGTSIAPPANETTLTAPTQLYLGPEIFTRLDFPFGPVGLEVKGGVAPYMLGMLSQTASDNSGLLGYWAIPSLYLRLGVVQLNVGYQYESYTNLTSGNYSYTRSGPLARLDLRF